MQCENSLVDIHKNEIEKENTRICSNMLCNSVYLNCKWKCNLCRSKFTKNISNTLPVKPKQSSITGDKYLNLGQTKCSNHKPNKMREPILLNPNSYENIQYILKSLKENLNIGSGRHWTFIGCDGPPYCLASQLIERTQNYMTVCVC